MGRGVAVGYGVYVGAGVCVGRGVGVGTATNRASTSAETVAPISGVVAGVDEQARANTTRLTEISKNQDMGTPLRLRWATCHSLPILFMCQTRGHE